MRQRSRASAWVVAMVLVAALARPAEAQRQYEVTPFIGYLAPLGTLFKGGDLGDVKLTQTGGFVFGGALALNVSPKLAIEASLAFASGRLEADPGADDDDHLTIFSAVARYRINSTVKPTKIQLIGGLGVVRHSGDAFDNLEAAGLKGATDAALIAGAGITVPLDRRINLRVEARNHLYMSKVVDDEDNHSDTSLQDDLTLTAGVNIPLGKPIRRRR